MSVLDQLADELERAALDLAAVVGPAELASWPVAARAAGARLAGPLVSDDGAEAAGTAAAIMTALWPHGDPDDVGHAHWWATPLGTACARALIDVVDDRGITAARAATILGLQRGSIGAMIARGHLDTHPDAAVSRRSVLLHLANRPNGSS